MHEKFEWEPGMSAPKNYPMEGYRIKFIYPDSTGISWPLDVAGLGTGWGEESGSVAVGDDKKPLPIGLEISWLSYTEDQFYNGSFKLPYDTILNLFEKGWPDFNYSTNPPIQTKSSYNQIIAGMAPGGVVVVWLSGAGHIIDIGRFQATKTNINMNAFIGRSDIKVDQDNYVKDFFSYKEAKEFKDNLEKNGIPYGLWDKYRQRFIMRPTVIYDWPKLIKTSQLALNYYSGEEETLDSATIEKNEYTSRVRPQKFSFYWYVDSAGKNQGYQLTVEFNEAEIMKAYAEVYGNASSENKTQGDLIVEVNRGNDEYRVFLQGNGKKVELLQSTGEIYLTN